MIGQSKRHLQIVHRQKDARENHAAVIIIIIITIVIDAVYVATAVNASKFCNETADRTVLFVDQKVMWKFVYIINVGQKIDETHQNRRQAMILIVKMKCPAMIIVSVVYDINETRIVSKIKRLNDRELMKNLNPTIKNLSLRLNVCCKFFHILLIFIVYFIKIKA